MLKKIKDIKVLKKSNPLDDWVLDIELGKGSFGEVYLAKNQQGDLVAAKICAISCDADFLDMKQEVEILTVCDHPNIVKSKASYYHQKKIWMILEFCSGGALDEVIEKVDGFDEKTIKCSSYQIFLGLEYLHKNGIIHRDIKAGNIMLTENGVCKIADFGVSAIMPSPSDLRNTFIGTPYWMAPECILTESLTNQKYGTKADVWSMGVTLIEMGEVLPPNCEFPPPQVMLLRIRSEPPCFKEPERWSSYLIELVTLTLFKDPNKRYSCTQCLQHPFYHGNDAKDRDPLIEAYRTCKALDQGCDIEELDEDIMDVDESMEDSNESSNKSTSRDKQADSKSIGSDNRTALRTIKKTVKIEMNGVTKSKTFIKVVDNENKELKEREKSMRQKVMNQMKALKLEEHRELKKLEAAHTAQLNELINKSKAEYEASMEKYYSECDNLNKLITKDIEKKKSQIKNDLEKAFKKHKQNIDKERKLVIAAQKSKNKKLDKQYLEPDYIKNILNTTTETFTQQREHELEEFRKHYHQLITQKSEQLDELLKNVILNKFVHTLDTAALKRNQICSTLELILQHRLKSNQKELAMTMKYMSDKLQSVKRDQERELRELPKNQRNKLKKEMDALKKSIRQQKVRNEKEMLNKRHEELIEKMRQETNETKTRHEKALKSIESQNEMTLKEIQEYHEEKNKSTHMNYQEKLYELHIEDELLFKSELLKMYHLRKCRLQEHEVDISLARSATLDIFTNINVELFN